MDNKQLSFVVRGNWFWDDDEYIWWDNTDDLNEYLKKGWKVISTSPMGAFSHGGTHTALANNGFASLVILEK